ncbi:MAG: HIT family protein [Nanoarchaeota archaeon]|nr:HIT family protein [Nanoarchaeota archaeon]
MEEQCLFCQLANNQQSQKVYEDDKISVVMDIKPVNPGQVLVIPKEHHSSFLGMPNELLAQTMLIARLMGGLMFQALKAQGVNILVSVGPAAGQRVGHAFVYVIPRFDEDNAGLILNQKEVTQEQLQEAYKKLTTPIAGQKETPEEKVEESKPKPVPKPPIPPRKPAPRAG